MTNDPPLNDTDADATHRWLDGLTGQPGSGAAHREGARARAALAPDERDTATASWRDIELRAGVESAAPAGDARPAQAANDPARWRRFGWAAALMAAVAVAALVSHPPPTPDATMRGVGGPAAPSAQWLVERPGEAAESLAAELRGLQADVTVTVEGDATVLRIQAPPGAVKAINARLAALETGLDADGTLTLSVRQRR